MKRKAGEFFVFDQNGEGYDAKIKMPKVEPIKQGDINVITEREIQKYYNYVLKHAKTL